MGVRAVPNDPSRRARIVDAALDVIVEVGVHRTTHRRVAARAEVPLGSMTYYFDSLDDIIRAAFALLVETMSTGYAQKVETADTLEQACDAVTDLICGQEYADREQVVAIYEMYSYANHDTAVATMMSEWLAHSRAVLTRYFSPEASGAIDALVEGWPMHRAMAGGALDRNIVRTTVLAIAAALPGEHPTPALLQQSDVDDSRHPRVSEVENADA